MAPGPFKAPPHVIIIIIIIIMAFGILTGKQPLDKGSAQGQAGTDTRHLGNLLEEDRLLSAKDVGSRAEITLPR
ncbi:hypothetical protein F2P81_007008 [Scophthalmus maximus]|uniref:Uncharacterized protein n=1 Tax=Scophthalmus maximus TaxID=52904 RepID=A0A6A4TB73_SCOMX|nr:hypothetical protein F2P81_007008 [Scophthalmus maximus]